MRMALAGLATFALAGCGTGAPRDLAEVPRVEGNCSAESLSGYAGRDATAEIARELMQRSGARVLRWIPPDSAVTMDYSPARLNIAYDRAMRIERISCG